MSILYKIRVAYMLTKNNFLSYAKADTLADALEAKIKLENSKTCKEVHVESFHPMFGWFNLKELPSKILQASKQI